MTTSQSKFAQALTSDRQLVTAEVYAPRDGGAEAVKKLAAALPSALDAVVVADNPDGIYGSALATAALLAGEGREAVVTLSTRDRNRIALESDALGASALGVSAILCLSGNHQSLGACPQAGSAYDIDSTQLLRMVKGLDVARSGAGSDSASPPDAGGIESHQAQEEDLGRRGLRVHPAGVRPRRLRDLDGGRPSPQGGPAGARARERAAHHQRGAG